MPDLKLTIIIPEAKVPDYTEKFLALFPNTEEDDEGVPIYTDNEWQEEFLLRYYVNQLGRGGKMQVRQAEIDFKPTDVTRGLK